MISQEHFRLTKWYLDCVSSRGESFIGYAAILRWKRFELQYSSIFTGGESGPGLTRTSLRDSSAPESSSEGIRWASPLLMISGDWHPLAPPVERQLLTTPNGSIDWKCVQPHARAKIRLHKDVIIEGLGYVEKLELSIPPWKLPIDTLRWGRFVSDNDSIVWIEWVEAERSQVHVFVNGRQMNGCTVGDDRITMEHGQMVLRLEVRRSLREGPLVSTALSMIPGIGSLFPGKIVHTHESKWLSKGRFTVGNNAAEEGWTIHERVDFK